MVFKDRPKAVPLAEHTYTSCWLSVVQCWYCCKGSIDHMNRLHIDMDWAADVVPGTFIIVECWRILDPDVFTDVYKVRH